jgi:hypothetical protein
VVLYYQQAKASDYKKQQNKKVNLVHQCILLQLQRKVALQKFIIIGQKS